MAKSTTYGNQSGGLFQFVCHTPTAMGALTVIVNHSTQQSEKKGGCISTADPRGKSIQMQLTRRVRRTVSSSRGSVKFCCWVSASHVLFIPFWLGKVVPFIFCSFLLRHNWLFVPLELPIWRGWEWPFDTLCRAALMTCSIAAATFKTR